MIYVVLGMHKSGTSLVAELLHKAGISMVDEIQERTYDDGAYYERQSCYDLNMALLGWTDKELLYRESHLDQSSIHTEKMRAIIQKNEAIHPDWGFKDPRTCMTYPLWAKELPPHRLIVVFRPIEDIWPRYEYKGWRFWKAWQRATALVEAWLAYNNAILKILEQTNADYLVLSYRLFLSEEAEFQRLADFVQRPLIDVRHRKPQARLSDWLIQWAKQPFKQSYISVLDALEAKRKSANAS